MKLESGHQLPQKCNLFGRIAVVTFQSSTNSDIATKNVLFIARKSDEWAT